MMGRFVSVARDQTVGWLRDVGNSFEGKGFSLRECLLR
jgi:hypothetical protein